MDQICTHMNIIRSMSSTRKEYDSIASPRAIFPLGVFPVVKSTFKST